MISYTITATAPAWAILWLSVGLIFYAYFGYYFLLRILRSVRPMDITHGKWEPSVSVIIAARNEEKRIDQRLRNLASQSYPSEKTEIIVVSDGSDDGTNKAVRSFSTRAENVRLISYFPSKGKPCAINLGVQAASGEVIVFADARQQFDDHAIRNLVRTLSDPSVGCVSGELFFYQDSNSRIEAEMGAYWNFEKKIRRLESETGSVVGATGAIYAIKKEFFEPIPEDIILDDVLIPLNIAKKGYRIAFEPTARAWDVVSQDFSKEKKRKIRTLMGNWQLIFNDPWLVIPFGHPLWFRFISHKALRLIVPFLAAASIIMALIIGGNLLKIILWTTLAVTALAFLPGENQYTKRLATPVRAILQLNYCAIMAFFCFCMGKKNVW